MLSETQRGKLAAIEEACLRMEAREEVLTTLQRRVGKLKSAKHLAVAQAQLSEAQQERLELETFVRDETHALFNDAFGLELDQVVRVVSADGAGQEPFVVNQMRARQLTNGLGVFFVAGDSLERNVNDKQPVPLMFRISEDSGDTFVVES